MIARPAQPRGPGFLLAQLGVYVSVPGATKVAGVVRDYGWDGRDKALVRVVGSRLFLCPDCRRRSSACNPAKKEYRVLVLTAEGHILDQQILTCADDDEAKRR